MISQHQRFFLSYSVKNLSKKPLSRKLKAIQRRYMHESIAEIVFTTGSTKMLGITTASCEREAVQIVVDDYGDDVEIESVTMHLVQ